MTQKILARCSGILMFIGVSMSMCYVGSHCWLKGPGKLANKNPSPFLYYISPTLITRQLWNLVIKFVFSLHFKVWNALVFGFTSPTHTYFFVGLDIYILKMQCVCLSLSLKGGIRKYWSIFVWHRAHLGLHWAHLLWHLQEKLHLSEISWNYIYLYITKYLYNRTDNIFIYHCLRSGLDLLA